VIQADGTVIPVEILASEVHFKGRTCILGTFRDITERQKVEKDLLQRESLLRTLIESAPFEIWARDKNEIGILENKHLVRHFGSILGKLPDNPLVSKEISRHWQSNNQRALQGEIINDECVYVVDGVERTFHQILAPIIVNNVVEGITGFNIDITERKSAEKSMRLSEERLRQISDSSNDFISSYDLQSRFVSANRALCNALQLSEAEIIGKTHKELNFPEEQCLEWDNLHKMVLEKGHTIFAESETPMPDGLVHHFEIALYPLNGYEGNTVGIGVVTRDITERKKSELALVESQQLFQGLFNASPDAILLIDPYHESVSWPILDCNEAACRMNGYSREEMIGQSIDLINGRSESAENREKYLNNLKTNKVIHGEFVHKNKEGHIFPIETSSSLVNIGGKNLILGIDRDITERKQAEEALKVSEFRLKRAEIASKSGNWELFLDTNIILGSEGAAKIYGLNDLEFKYERIRDIPLPEYKQMLDLSLKNLIENDIPYDCEFKIRALDTGEIKDIHSIAVIDRGSNIVLGIVHDITERKQAELELRKSEERYSRFISQISEGVFRFECDVPMDISLPVEDQIDFIYDHMVIAECNQSFLKMYQFDNQDDVIGKTHLDFHGGRNNTMNRNALRDFIQNNYRVENSITEERNIQGNISYFSNNSIGIIENQKLVRIWGTQTDITEKIRADHVQQVLFSISNAALSSIDLVKLIELISEEVGKLLDSTNFYIAFYDPKTEMLSTVFERDEKDVFETWPAANSLTGYVIKKQKSLLLREEDVENFYLTEGVESIGTPAKVWLGVPLVSNKLTIGALVVQSYDNVDAYDEKDQRMLEFISHQISISIDRKKSEKDLKLLGKAFEQSPVTIVITDKNGIIEYVNPKFYESTGYKIDEAKGKNPRILKSGFQSSEYYANLWDTIKSGKDWFGEFQNKRKNGEIYWESAVISPITNESGEIEYLLAVKEDITEKKKMIDDLIFARNKAEESDRLKSSFLANMSHEIRTPLNSIIGFSELLLDSDFGIDQHEEFARTINESGNGLLNIISDIMDFSKIEAGQINLSKKAFSVRKLISDIHREYSFRASTKGLEFRLDLENQKDDVQLLSDEQRIRQILINFVGNAIKFTDTGYIEMGFKSSGEEVYIYVKDTGIGIPEQFHHDIFERFRQLEVAHTRKYGGNGLGLAISKNLTELMGGHIGLESEVGVGSTFYITIPNTYH